MPITLDDDLRRRLLETLLTPAERRKMTYEEFLAWAGEDTLAEWVNGEVIMTSPASRRHQEIILFLRTVLGLYVEQQGLGRVVLPPFQMKLARSGREPDLLYVAREHLERLQETYLVSGTKRRRRALQSPKSASETPPTVVLYRELSRRSCRFGY